MSARLGLASPVQAADLIARAVGAVALAALAMIHVIDSPARHPRPRHARPPAAQHATQKKEGRND